MSEPTQRQVDEDLARSVDLFQRADVGEVVPLEPCRPRRLLAVLDGSSQDLAVASFARDLHLERSCQVNVLWLPGSDRSMEENVSEVLQRANAETIVQPGEEEYDRILAASEASEAELVMIPCPCGRDFESIGEESIGTVIDVLTARSRVPVVAIRRPDALGRRPTEHLRIVLTGENAAAEHAARWAVGLAHKKSRLELLLLVEESFYENFRVMLHAIQPEARVSYADIEHALARTYARLHASIQHVARECGLTYELLVRYEGDGTPVTPEDPKSHPALMILALERDSHDSRGEVADFIRRSPHPVMVVPVGGPD